MKSKDFIAMIQKEDPSGEYHIRVGGETPTYAECKPGYWDGPYSYIEDGKLIISTKGNKIDIGTTDFEDWIWDHNGDYSDIKLDLTYLKDKTEEYTKKFEKISQEYKRCNDQLMKGSIIDVIDKVKDGWRIYQNKGRTIGHYNSMHYRKGFERDTMTQGATHAVIDSGYFYYDKTQWIFDPLKGKSYNLRK